jgi:hypothetical protein
VNDEVLFKVIKEICNTIFTLSWYEPRSIAFIFVKQKKKEEEDYFKTRLTGM